MRTTEPEVGDREEPETDQLEEEEEASAGDDKTQKLFDEDIEIICCRDRGTSRIFVALFDYDPPTMSPNPEACDEELPFREGQLIKVKKVIL